MANGFMNPQNQFLMTAGAHLMGQPYSPVPQSAFSGLGNAFDQGMGAYQNALILQEKQRQEEEKRQQAAAAAAAKQAQQQQFMQAISTLPPDRKQALTAFYAADPQGAVKALYELGAPAEVDNTMGDSATDSAVFNLGLQGKPRGQWTPAEAQAVASEADRIRKLNSPAPAAPPSPYTQALVGQDIKFMDKLDTEAQGAMSRLEKINAIKGLNTMLTNSGSVAAPVLANIQGVLQEFGIAPVTAGDPAAAKEALNALQTELVMDERKYGPPDARFTDKDMEYYRQMQPGLSQTPEGREFLTSMLEQRQFSAIRRQEEFDASIEDFVGQGYSREEATQMAVAEARKSRRASSKKGEGQFVNEDGSLTPLGQKMAEMQARTAGQAAAAATGSAAPQTFNSQEEALASGLPEGTVVTIDGQQFRLRYD